MEEGDNRGAARPRRGPARSCLGGRRGGRLGWKGSLQDVIVPQHRVESGLCLHLTILYGGVSAACSRVTGVVARSCREAEPRIGFWVRKTAKTHWFNLV